MRAYAALSALRQLCYDASDCCACCCRSRPRRSGVRMLKPKPMQSADGFWTNDFESASFDELDEMLERLDIQNGACYRHAHRTR